MGTGTPEHGRRRLGLACQPDVGCLNAREGVREEKWTSFDLRSQEDPHVFNVSMTQLGWQNDEKTLQEDPDSEMDRRVRKTECSGKKETMVDCVTGLPMSKQQELVEASFQLRARLLEMNAFTFSAIDLETIPVDVAYVTTLSQQEVPDYFAGPAMAKTITQETRVVFGSNPTWKGRRERRKLESSIVETFRQFTKMTYVVKDPFANVALTCFK